MAEASGPAAASLAAASQPAFEALAESLAGSSSVFLASTADGQQRLLGQAQAPGSSCGELGGGTLAQPLQMACLCRRGAPGSSGLPGTAPVLEYQPAQGEL